MNNETEFRVGSRVYMEGDCQCSRKPISGREVWFDAAACYHNPLRVQHVFSDKTSVWVRNGYGNARRLHGPGLVRME